MPCFHLETKSTIPKDVQCHYISWISHKYHRGYTESIMQVEYTERNQWLDRVVICFARLIFVEVI